MAKDHVGRHVETRFESHYEHVSRTNNSFVSRYGDCETEIGTKKTYSPSKTTVLFPGFMKDLYCCVSLLVDVLWLRLLLLRLPETIRRPLFFFHNYDITPHKRNAFRSPFETVALSRVYIDSYVPLDMCAAIIHSLIRFSENWFSRTHT